MARTAESGSWCADWKRDTTASSEGFRDNCQFLGEFGKSERQVHARFRLFFATRYTKATPKTSGRHSEVRQLPLFE